MRAARCVKLGYGQGGDGATPSARPEAPSSWEVNKVMDAVGITGREWSPALEAVVKEALQENKSMERAIRAVKRALKQRGYDH